MNTYHNSLNLEATELRLGLPGREESDKQCPLILKTNKRSASEAENEEEQECSPPRKTQIVGWPPVRSCRKNIVLDEKKYVKVSMDGAAYLRKVDLSNYKSYQELLKALENMLKCKIGVYSERELGYINNGSEHTPTYEDKDGDWMLVGDVPWHMFITSCKRLRIIKPTSDPKPFITSL